MSEINTINKLAKLLRNRVFKVLFLLFFVALVTSWLWLPPLYATLAYGDWTCAYKKCVVVKGDEQ